MSYFAEPNFIKYDEWFDDDLEKNKLDVEHKKIKTTSKIHDFFYEQSNYKIGGSENNFQLEIKVNEKELISNNYFENTSTKNNSLSNKKFQLLKKITKNKLKFNLTKKLIYSLSIFGLVFIFGFILFFISQSKKNESNMTNKLFSIEKEF
ncbi:hypothetical protein PMT9312_1484 [Prochlorococcus marinus str. MIT 9312]|uniref:Uncharacterized protein n=1 Tax=Prochlorococcus marinus (strain MIT 9312) TaxID=74546 RepID=Q319A1_PROM9|nr:hypothetical protein [Prochlorococcus marinus]ABB50544.1 hypothetical protein PMT9312_1484 [Prochlorococcus marinus str. MIT 9312]KGG01431.1 hypothetical protein EU97_0477 [Prochlorococcus marinus str. MIT 9311]